MKHKNALDQILIRRLRDAGCPTPEDCEDDPMPGVRIGVGRPEITRVYVMPGWTEYVLALRVTNRSFTRLEVQEFKCRFFWRVQLIGPMAPRIQGPEIRKYRLPGSGKQFPYELVINHRTGRSGSINPGDSLEGILLAFRKAPRVPDECLVHPPVIPAELSVVDQHGREHVSQIEVEVDRTDIIKSLRPVRRPGQGLYGPSGPHTNFAVRERAARPVTAEIWSGIPDKQGIPTSPGGTQLDVVNIKTEDLRP